MLDLKYIRAHAEELQQAVYNKNEKADIAALLAMDEQKRTLQFEFDQKRAEQNKVSKEIGQLKAAGQDTAPVIARMGQLADELKELNTRLQEADKDLEYRLLTVPNVCNAGVPVGKNSDDNKIVRHWGEPRKFDFPLKDHFDLGEQRGLTDFARGAAITGSGFPVFWGVGALMERALINFMLDLHIKKHGYTEAWVPFMVSRKTMTGTGQLPKLENDMYHVNEDDLFLIPTAEVPVTNLFAGEIVPPADLPKKLVAYTPCFRREAGSYGKDTRGLSRVHQFNKVEMVRFVKPEDSYKVLEEMVEDAQDVLKALELPHRVVLLCTGDTSFASAQTYDLEVWAPATQKWLEVSSVSNFEDFQARRANIRTRDEQSKPMFVHTLNGSGLATPRTMIAIWENWQQADGSVVIPPVLRPYMHGLEVI